MMIGFMNAIISGGLDRGVGTSSSMRAQCARGRGRRATCITVQRLVLADSRIRAAKGYIVVVPRQISNLWCQCRICVRRRPSMRALPAYAFTQVENVYPLLRRVLGDQDCIPRANAKQRSQPRGSAAARNSRGRQHRRGCGDSPRAPLSCRHTLDRAPMVAIWCPAPVFASEPTVSYQG